jgi:hypothetical protein
MVGLSGGRILTDDGSNTYDIHNHPIVLGGFLMFNIDMKYIIIAGGGLCLLLIFVVLFIIAAYGLVLGFMASVLVGIIHLLIPPLSFITGFAALFLHVDLSTKLAQVLGL